MPVYKDEGYYSVQGVFDGFSNWTNLSFGHPPGWNIVNDAFYSLFGYSLWMVHFIPLFLNSIILALVYYQLRNIIANHLALLCCALILNSAYFLAYSSLNEPVIAATLLGILSTLYWEEKNIFILALYYH